MAIIGEWIRRLGYLLRRTAREDELRREMEAHRAEMGDPAAFGNTLRLREEAREAWDGGGSTTCYRTRASRGARSATVPGLH